jgi:hypothetical protein
MLLGLTVAGCQNDQKQLNWSAKQQQSTVKPPTQVQNQQAQTQGWQNQPAGSNLGSQYGNTSGTMNGANPSPYTLPGAGANSANNINTSRSLGNQQANTYQYNTNPPAQQSGGPATGAGAFQQTRSPGLGSGNTYGGQALPETPPALNPPANPYQPTAATNGGLTVPGSTTGSLPVPPSQTTTHYGSNTGSDLTPAIPSQRYGSNMPQGANNTMQPLPGGN